MRKLLVLLVALIAYGSLFPFRHVPHTTSWDDFFHLLSWPSRLSVLDSVGNFALFFPLGLVLGVSRRPSWILVGVPLSIALAIGLQYAQFWFPSRVPSGADILFNVVGCAIGTGVGLMVSRWVGHDGQATDRSARVWTALALVVLWVGYRWFPLVPTLDVQNAKDALKPLLRERSLSITGAAHDMVAWLMWFRLCRYAFRDALPLLTCIAFALLVLSLEPLFYRNTVSLSNVVGLAAAALTSFLFWRGEHPLTALLVVSGVVIVAWSVLPMNMAAQPREFVWMPLAGLLQGSLMVNSAALLEKLFLYGAWVFLALYRGWRPAVVLAVAICTLLVVEWAQRWSAGRTPEITDPLLALFCWIVMLSTVSGKFTKRMSRSE
jgi:VanZ family protein